jgi:hypothetical protein
MLALGIDQREDHIALPIPLDTLIRTPDNLLRRNRFRAAAGNTEDC